MAGALVPYQRSDAVARCDNNLLVLAGFELSRRDPSTNGADLHGHELVAADVLEPVIACQQIRFAVAVDVRRGRAFRIPGRAGVALSGLTAEDGDGWPRFYVAR